MSTQPPDDHFRNPYPRGTLAHAFQQVTIDIGDGMRRAWGVADPDALRAKLAAEVAQEETPPRVSARAVALIVWPMAAVLVAATTAAGWQPTLMQIAALTAATYAGGRVIAMERVGSPIRDALDSTPLREVVSCPRCSGAWVALLLVLSVTLAPQLAWPVVWMLAIVGINFTWQDMHHSVVRITGGAE